MSELALANRYQMVSTRVTRLSPQLHGNSRKFPLRSPKNHTVSESGGRLSARDAELTVWCLMIAAIKRLKPQTSKRERTRETP